MKNSYRKTSLLYFLALVLFIFLSDDAWSQPGRHTIGDPDFQLPKMGIFGQFRVAGCEPDEDKLAVTAKRRNIWRIFNRKVGAKPVQFHIGRDKRGITTASFTFDSLHSGTYDVTASISDPNCQPGRWIVGPNKSSTIHSKNPWDAIVFLYVTQEQEKTLDMSDLVEELELVARTVDPSLRLHNHGQQVNGSRWVANQSYVKYLKIQGSPPHSYDTEPFSIPEVREELVDGALGVLKYYVDDINSISHNDSVEAYSYLTWNPDSYSLDILMKLEDSGVEIKGYHKNILGLSDDNVPDINLVGPLAIKTSLIPNYSYWDGRFKLPVQSTEFVNQEIQAGGTCQVLPVDACNALIGYKRRIQDSVRDAIHSLLSGSEGTGYVADLMELRLSGNNFMQLFDTSHCPDSEEMNGAFITAMEKEGGNLVINFVQTHLDRDWIGCHIKVTITKRPTGNNLVATQTFDFNAKVSGTEDQRVVWWASRGDINSQTGLYSAPNRGGGFARIRATSVADPSASVTIRISIEDPNP